MSGGSIELSIPSNVMVTIDYYHDFSDVECGVPRKIVESAWASNSGIYDIDNLKIEHNGKIISLRKYFQERLDNGST